MLRFNIKIAFKNLIHSPLLALVNIVGLALAMVCVMFIALWLRSELSYDKHIPNHKRLYRITVEVNNPKYNQYSHFARPYQSWLTDLKASFPEIEDEVRIFRNENYNLKYLEKVFQCRFHQVDKQFLRVFGVKLLQGNADNALVNPYTLVISKSMALKYFAGVNPVGKSILVYCRNCAEKLTYTITGVMEDMPQTSHFKADMLASIEKPKDPSYWAYYYLLLKPGSSPERLLAKLPAYITKVAGKEETQISKCHLQNVADIHLYSDKNRELENNGNMATIIVFMLIACFILLIVLVNYFNIRLSAYYKQQRNLLVQKTYGANNVHIFSNSIIELLVVNLLSIIGAMFVAKLLIEQFNQLSEKQFIFYNNIGFILVVFSILLIINLLVGLLPTLFSKAKLQVSSNSKSALPVLKKDRLVTTKVLIIIQFVAAIMLITGAFAINRQVKLLMNNRLGAKCNNIVSIADQPIQVKNNYQAFKDELLKNTLIENVTSGMETPGDQVLDRMAFETTGIADADKEKMPYIFPVDDNYFTFFNIPIIAGENFPEYTGNDSLQESYIVNESALKLWGWQPEEAIGKPFSLVFRINGEKNLFNGGKIVGVVKDFQISSSKDDVQPMVYFQKSVWLFNCLIQIDTLRKTEALQYIQNTWKKYYADYACDVVFVDDLYKNLYSKEIQQQKLVSLFTLLAILISSLGLWSISSVISKQRTKEVGIRKVNGAKTIEIMYLLNREFLSMVLIAIVIAVPLSYFLLNKWLQSYASRTELNWWMFFFAGLLAFVVALITISWQAWQTANRNPVEALRSE